MRKKSFVAAGLAVSLLAALGSTGLARAASSGVGTSKASTTVLSVQAGANGALLSARLLGDDARSTIDKTVSTPEAYSRLTGLSISSAAVPALNLTAPSAAMESRTPGGSPSYTTASVNLGSPGGGVTIPAAVATGTLSLANLTSAVDGNGARAGMTASASNVTVAGGLASVGGVTSNLGASAGGAGSAGSRTVKVDHVSVLDLGSLLRGLGVNLADLPVPTISALLTQLSATLPGHPDLNADVTTVRSQITAATAELTQLNAAIAAAGSGATATIDSVLAGLLGVSPGSVAVSTLQTAVTTVTGAINQLNALLGQLIDQGLAAIDNLTLLAVDGVEVGIGTKAGATLADTSADIVARIGSVKVGGITIPGLDLTAATSLVNALVSNVNTKLSGALATISPDLRDLVTVGALEQAKSVSASNGYNTAQATVTALSATVRVPANLAAIVSGIVGAVGANDVLTGAGQAVPATAAAMAALNTALGAGVQALSAGGTVKVVQVLGSSDFAPGSSTPAATPGGELPKTGGENARLAALALLLVALGLGFCTWFTRPLDLD